MPTTDFISQMYFKLNGSNASAEIMRDLRELVVDTSLHLPDMFTIHLDDPNLKWIDASEFDIGKLVEISGKEAEASSPTTLITNGEITALEPEMTEEGASTVIFRGYDKTHRLHRGKKARTFLQSSDSDIVKKIAGECGLSVKADSTGEVHEHVFQDFKTDIEFLRERAKRNSYYLYFQDGKLNFCKKPGSSGTKPVLKWGENLRTFQGRFTSADQVEEAEVHGWDVKQKKAIIGKTTSPQDTPSVADVTHGGKAAKSAFRVDSSEIVHNIPVQSQGDAEKIAQSLLDDKSHAFFEAEGTCDGNPHVRAGAEVEIEGLGDRFSGTYRITRAVHRYSFEGYVTEFEISGRRANTLSQILEKKDKEPYGVVIGIVTNINDPDNLARVKVKYPTISDQLESNWARVTTPMAGPERGFEFIPEVNDEVLVAFEYNDFNRPYVVGSLWNGKDKPPEADSVISNGKVQKRIIQSRAGHVIVLDDSDGSEKITVTDKTGNNSIEIDSAANKITVKASGPINMETSDDITIKGNNINLEAKMDTNVKATNAKITAQSGLDLEGTQAKVKGSATVNIEGSASTTIKGGVINLN